MSLQDITEPGKLNITITAGTSFHKELILKDASGTVIDLTGYTGYAQIRKGSRQNLLATFTVTITAIEGKVELDLSKTETAGLSGPAKWDLILESGPSDSHLVVEGDVEVIKSITVVP